VLLHVLGVGELGDRALDLFPITAKEKVRKEEVCPHEKRRVGGHLKLLALLEVVDVRAHHASGVILEDRGRNEARRRSA
jgi:hypothetical protein